MTARKKIRKNKLRKNSVLTLVGELKVKLHQMSLQIVFWFFFFKSFGIYLVTLLSCDEKRGFTLPEC